MSVLYRREELVHHRREQSYEEPLVRKFYFLKPLLSIEIIIKFGDGKGQHLNLPSSCTHVIRSTDCGYGDSDTDRPGLANLPRWFAVIATAFVLEG